MATLSPNPNPNPNLFSLKQSHTLLKIPTPPVPSFLSSLISSYSALGERPPNPRTFPPLFKACAAASDLARGVQLHSHVVKFGFWHNMYVGVAVMDMYMKSGEVGEATKVFDGMGERDTVAWNALVTGYLQNGRAEEAVAVFERMRRAGVGVSGVAVASVVAACAQLRLSDLGKRIHSLVVKSGFDADIVISTALLDMYANCGDLRLKAEEREIQQKGEAIEISRPFAARLKQIESHYRCTRKHQVPERQKLEKITLYKTISVHFAHVSGLCACAFQKKLDAHTHTCTACTYHECALYQYMDAHSVQFHSQMSTTLGW